MSLTVSNNHFLVETTHFWARELFPAIRWKIAWHYRRRSTKSRSKNFFWLRITLIGITMAQLMHKHKGRSKFKQKACSIWLSNCGYVWGGVLCQFYPLNFRRSFCLQIFYWNDWGIIENLQPLKLWHTDATRIAFRTWNHAGINFKLLDAVG